MFDTCNRLDYDEAQSAQNICVNMTGANYLEGELAGVKLDHGCSPFGILGFMQVSKVFTIRFAVDG